MAELGIKPGASSPTGAGGHEVLLAITERQSSVSTFLSVFIPALFDSSSRLTNQQRNSRQKHPFATRTFTGKGRETPPLSLAAQAFPHLPTAGDSRSQRPHFPAVLAPPGPPEQHLGCCEGGEELIISSVWLMGGGEFPRLRCRAHTWSLN